MIGSEPHTAPARAALATIYTALMTELLIERLQGPGDIVVEGGFTRAPGFACVMAALARQAVVRVSLSASGAAEGAMLLARWGAEPPAEASRVVAPWVLPGLAEYRARWRTALPLPRTASAIADRD